MIFIRNSPKQYVGSCRVLGMTVWQLLNQRKNERNFIRHIFELSIVKVKIKRRGLPLTCNSEMDAQGRQKCFEGTNN